MDIFKIFARRTAMIAASLSIVLSIAAFCQNQSNPSDSKKDSNAFPVSQSEAAANAAGQQPSTSPQSASRKPANNATPSKGSTSQDNPFPEAQSKAAANEDTKDNQPSASDAPGGYSSSDEHLPPSALGQGDASEAHQKLDSFARDHTEDGRIENDLAAADLYMKNGNYRGALLRYQDTLQYDPQNDTALFGIAEVSCRQNRAAEAMAQFKSYAKDNPQGKYALKAEKMLAHPNRCMHNF
jgi:tetratricopeptide (TPR) repeat protein